MAFHVVHALKRFERADQDTSTDAGWFASDVEHEVISVTEVDIGMSMTEKQGAGPRGRSTKVMSGGIARRVSFGLHDAPDQDAERVTSDQDFSDQEARQRHGADREFGTPEAPDGYFWCHFSYFGRQRTGPVLQGLGGGGSPTNRVFLVDRSYDGVNTLHDREV